MSEPVELRKIFEFPYSKSMLVVQAEKKSVVMLLIPAGKKAGCVICHWIFRMSDGEVCAEIQSVGDRLVSSSIEDAETLLKALRTGQKIAHILIDLDIVTKEDVKHG